MLERNDNTKFELEFISLHKYQASKNIVEL
jgi:hypothetical protein